MVCEIPHTVSTKMYMELHYEVELAVVIGKGGSKIAETKAMDHVAGYALALDMTARNLQIRWMPRRKDGLGALLKAMILSVPLVTSEKES